MRLPEDRNKILLKHAPAWWIGVYWERCRQYRERANDKKRTLDERHMWRRLLRETAAESREEFRRFQ